jgi:hypothetical protein
MFSYNLIEYMAYERHKALLLEAERMRVVKILQHQQSGNGKVSRKVRNWIGTQMVNWGLKLQDYRISSPSQAAITRTSDAECP